MQFSFSKNIIIKKNIVIKLIISFIDREYDKNMKYYIQFRKDNTNKSPLDVSHILSQKVNAKYLQSQDLIFAIERKKF